MILQWKKNITVSHVKHVMNNIGLQGFNVQVFLLQIYIAQVQTSQLESSLILAAPVEGIR